MLLLHYKMNMIIACDVNNVTVPTRFWVLSL